MTFPKELLKIIIDYFMDKDGSEVAKTFDNSSYNIEFPFYDYVERDEKFSIFDFAMNKAIPHKWIKKKLSKDIYTSSSHNYHGKRRLYFEILQSRDLEFLEFLVSNPQEHQWMYAAFTLTRELFIKLNFDILSTDSATFKRIICNDSLNIDIWNYITRDIEKNIINITKFVILLRNSICDIGKPASEYKLFIPYELFERKDITIMLNSNDWYDIFAGYVRRFEDVPYSFLLYCYHQAQSHHDWRYVENLIINMSICKQSIKEGEVIDLAKQKRPFGKETWQGIIDCGDAKHLRDFIERNLAKSKISDQEWIYICLYYKDVSFYENHMSKITNECWTALCDFSGCFGKYEFPSDIMEFFFSKYYHKFKDLDNCIKNLQQAECITWNFYSVENRLEDLINFSDEFPAHLMKKKFTTPKSLEFLRFTAINKPEKLICAFYNDSIPDGIFTDLAIDVLNSKKCTSGTVKMLLKTKSISWQYFIENCNSGDIFSRYFADLDLPLEYFERLIRNKKNGYEIVSNPAIPKYYMRTYLLKILGV